VVEWRGVDSVLLHVVLVKERMLLMDWFKMFVVSSIMRHFK